MAMTRGDRYIDNVLSGKVAVSRLTRLTFERHRQDLIIAPENGWYFDRKSVQRILDFGQLLRHSPDKKSWTPFRPEPWQEAIISIVFGWKKKDGTRRFNYAYIEIPKKNGKTTWSAVIANYLLYFDGENEAEIYTAATVEKQAKICFNMAKKMIEHSPALSGRAKILTRNINIAQTMSKLEPLGRDSSTMEGINPHGGILDELHVWPSFEVFENMQSASVNRRQPLFWLITTSGRDKSLPCFGYRQLIIDILEGKKTQADTFGVIYTLDDTDDWKDPRSWQKANPNWGVSVRPDRFESEFTGAMNDSGKEFSFKTKNLNLWVDAPEVWIKDEKWLACRHGIEPDQLIGQRCYGGLDLASHVDINALGLYFPDVDGHPVFKMYYWIPEAKARAQADKVDYLRWINEGWIRTTPGDVIDIALMVGDLLGILKQYQCQILGFDPAKAYHGVIQGLLREGYQHDQLHEFAQGIMSMTGPTKEFERLVTSGSPDHLGDPVLRWMLGNVQIYQDINDNIKPDKKRSRDKIDGIVAIIMAIGECMTKDNPADTRAIYTHGHSLRML